MPLPHTVKEIKLKNGLEGLLIDIPNASVFCYEFCFRAGNEFVRDVAVQQTAHILEHMAFKGCKRYPTADLLSREFTKNGAYNNASTGQTNMSYYGDSAKMEWQRILGLQMEALAEPIFTEESLVHEKQNVLSELNSQNANDVRVLWQNIGKALGDTALLDKEKIATIPHVGLDDIWEHYHRTHTLKNARFAIGGALEGREDEVMAMLEKWKLPKGEKFLEPEQLECKTAPPVVLSRSDRDDSLFGLVMSLHRKFSDKEDNAMSALNHMLTGTFHSRIFGQARERGLSYNIGASCNTQLDGNTEWSFGGQVNEEHAEDLMQLIVSELQRIASGGIDETILEETKLYGLGTYQKSYQTASEIVGSYAGDYFFDKSIKPIEDIPRHIKETDHNDIIALAREFIEKGEWCYGEIGNVTESHVNKRHAIFSKLFSKTKKVS